MQNTRSRLSRVRTIGAAFAVAASLVLTGCAGSSSDRALESDDVKLTDTGKEIEQVDVAFPGSLSNLYIGQESGILNYNLAATVQEGLVGHNAKGEIVPALAESWETPDDTTYVFKLRKDAKFQNGDPVTPKDVIYSINKTLDAEASPATAFYLANLESVEETGENEVTVKTKTADAAFLINLSSSGALVVTQDGFWESHNGEVGTAGSLLLGTGPYKVSEFQPDSHVTLERVDTWWGELPKAKKIRVDFIPDANTRLAAAKRGDIDIAFNVPINQANDWLELPDTRVLAENDLSYVGLLFDQSIEPYNKPEVRKAIAQGIDKDTIAERLLRGYGQAATAIMTPESLAAAYSSEEAANKLAEIPQNEYDADAAKKLLEEAGASDLSFELTYPNTGPQLGVAAQAISENLAEIGVKVSVREVPIEEWLATIGDGEHPVGFMWYFSTTGDPSEVNSYLVGADNPNHFKSEEAVKLVAEANSLTDPDARAAKLIELENLNAKETVNAPLWWGKSVTAFSNTVGVRDYSPYTFTGVWGADLFDAKAE